MSPGIKFLATEGVHDKVRNKVHEKVHDKVYDKVHDKVHGKVHHKVHDNVNDNVHIKVHNSPLADLRISDLTKCFKTVRSSKREESFILGPK